MTGGSGEMVDVGRDTGVPVTDYASPAGAIEGDVRHVNLRPASASPGKARGREKDISGCLGLSLSPL